MCVVHKIFTYIIYINLFYIKFFCIKKVSYILLHVFLILWLNGTTICTSNLDKIAFIEILHKYDISENGVCFRLSIKLEKKTNGMAQKTY